MPSFLSHPAAVLAVAPWQRRVPARLLVLAVCSTIVPDLDGIGYWLGVPYDHLFGHRGFTHSVAFALLWAGVWVPAARRWGVPPGRAFVLLFLATVSHPLLDMLTNGGLGIALAASFSNARLFFPWRPIQVSPMGMGFFSDAGLVVLASEARWVWLPALAVAVAGWLWRRQRSRLKRRD